MVLLLVASGLVSIYHWVYGQKIYPYVTVGAIELSNLSLEEGEKRLRQAVAEKPSTIELVFGNQVWPVELNEWKIVYDPQATAQQAYLLGRSRGWMKDIKTKWRQWQKKKKLEIKFDWDEKNLQETIHLMASQIEEPPIKPRLELIAGKEVRLIPGRNGRLIKKEELKNLLLFKIGQLDFSQTQIPVEIVTVKASGEEMAQAQTRAEELKDKKLQFKYGVVSQELKGQELLDLIDFKGGWNEERVASFSMRLAQRINRPAQNAVFQFDGKRVVEFKPALTGLKLNEEKTIELIKGGLTKLETDQILAEVIELPVITAEPTIKTENVNDLGIKELLGRGESTFHGSIASRKHNIALTAGRLNGILVPPGEIFSFNQAVGDISAATGYQTAYIIKDGRTMLGDGGGVCQDSTTMFRAILHAGLPIIERHPHSYRVTYYEQNAPPGLDATVYAPSVDLKFKNDTPGYILIQTKVDINKNYLAVELYGTSDGRKATISNVRLWAQVPPPADLYQDDPTLAAGVIKQVDWKAWGAKAAFDWKVVRNNEVLQERTFYSNYQPWQAVYLRGTRQN